MKTLWLAIFQLLLMTTAAAKGPSNWPLPRKMNFMMIASGIYHVYGQMGNQTYDSSRGASHYEPEFGDVAYGAFPSSIGPGNYIPVNIDDSTVTSTFNGHLAHVEWHYESQKNFVDNFDLYLDFDIDTATHTIKTFSYSRSSMTQPALEYNFSVKLRDLQYDTSKIWAATFNLNHVVSADCSHSFGTHYFDDGGYELEKLESITFEGSLSTTFLKVESRLAMSQSLDVRERGSLLDVYLPVDHRPGELEVYSTKGQQIASFPVGEWESKFTVPSLAPGFYFVRFRGITAKIIIGEAR